MIGIETGIRDIRQLAFEARTSSGHHVLPRVQLMILETATRATDVIGNLIRDA